MSQRKSSRLQLLLKLRGQSRSMSIRRYLSTTASGSASGEDKSTSVSLQRSAKQEAAATSMEECRRRNKVLTDYIKGHEWFLSHEFHLLRKLVMTPHKIKNWKQYYDKYPYIFDHEWECCDGRGDLLCTDGKNNFLVVELKSFTNSGIGSGKTHRTTIRKKRRQGEEQTVRFAKSWYNNNPQVITTVGVFVTEEGALKQVEFPSEDDRSSSFEASDSDCTFNNTD